MATTSEAKKGGFLKTWERFNTVTAVGFFVGGVALESSVLLTLAAIDAGQAFAIRAIRRGRENRGKSASLAPA